MKFEFINPSDRYFFEAPSLKVAATVTLMVGGGKCGAQCHETGESVPGFLFGGAIEWFEKEFGESFETYLKSPAAAPELVACLRSFHIPGEGTQDELRSSMNDFGGYARQVADRLEQCALAASEKSPA